MKTEQSIMQSLREAFQLDERVVVAYLFGSFAQGRMTAESDLDVAVLFRQDAVPAPIDLLELGNRLSALVGLEVDLLCLNSAGAIVTMQVLRKGMKIVERDPRKSVEFFGRAIGRYNDIKIVRRPIEQSILNGRIYG
jgi:predicted nucleotidyltransferase